MEKTPPKQVLVFDQRKRLIAVVGSVYSAYKMTGVGAGNISRVCSGTLMSSGHFYFRYMDNSIELEWTDLNTLKVDEYDKLCGTQRRIYDTTEMSRKGFKYNTKNKANHEN